MLILGNPSVKAESSVRVQKRLYPRRLPMNTYDFFSWTCEERERETQDRVYEITLQETRNNRRPSRIKQRLGKKRVTQRGDQTVNLRTYVVIVRFLSRRSSQICRVVKVKCLPHILSP